jgi:phosphoribosylformylglycinamidine synthase
MCFANREGGMAVDLTSLIENGEWRIENERNNIQILSSFEEGRGMFNSQLDIVRILFAENPALILQVREVDSAKVHEAFAQAGIKAHTIGKPVPERFVNILYASDNYQFDIDRLRDLWFNTSYLFDCRQSGGQQAAKRYNNYKLQPLEYKFPAHFEGLMAQYGIEPHRTKPTGIRAAIIREQGSQCDRETAWMMHLAGMDVKDVHTSDLITGHETLDDVNMIVFVGGFSNADVLGSAKGWAGAFLHNEKAKTALNRFYARPDTLSLGICNGCQLMIELGLITSNDEQQPRMEHNESKKFECAFVNVSIPENNSVMLHSLSGARLGVWVAHGEGKFNLPMPAAHYNVALRYSYDAYPANPNGSPQGIAAIYSADGRHLAMMPHPERAIYPWNWAHYPASRRHDRITPWVEAFVNAAEWMRGNYEK